MDLHLGWYRGEQVRVEHDVIYCEFGEIYAPAEHRELPNALARVKTASDAVDFVRRYGPLGLAHLVPPEQRTPGEPVPWFLAHAESIDLALRLAEALGRGDEEAVVNLLYRRISLPMPEGIEVIGDGKKVEKPTWEGFVIAVGPGRRFHPYMGDLMRKGPCEEARSLLRVLINENAAGVRRELRMENGVLVATFKARALIEGIWWMVGEIFAAQEKSGTALRICKECGTPFVVTDQRQKFCPPEYRQTESACGRRYRMRRRRASECRSTGRGKRDEPTS